MFFFPLTLLTTCKIKIIKNEKNTWRYYHFTLVSHKWWLYVVWFLRYGAGQTDFFVILCHFLPIWLGKSKFWKNDKKYLDIFCSFTPLLNPKIKIWKNAKCVLQMMIIWCMVPEILSTTDRIFCHFRLFFALLTPYNPENQNFEKMKKIPGGIIILNMSAINENHMMYDSWDMEHDRQNFFSFWTIFCPFTPPSPLLLTTQRIKIF